jgi:inner membrane protein
MENQEFTVFNRISHWLKTSLLVKLASMGFIILLLLIPNVMIQDMIQERQSRQSEAIAEISHSWGGAQSVAGPVLTIPYEEITIMEGKKSVMTRIAHFLPEELNVEGELDPEIRRRSIYDAILFQSNMTLSGSFKQPDFRLLNIDPDLVLWDQAKLSVGISGMSGIKSILNLDWNGSTLRMEPGAAYPQLIASGVSAAVPFEAGETYRFSIPVKLNGSGVLQFQPVGKTTRVNLKSTWPSPGFSGGFLPDTRTITDAGFDASWQILDLNRNYPQQWKDSDFKFDESTAFGVQLVQPVDEYAKNTRSAKYAILVIGLTFLTWFFFEILRHFHIHPFQYLLVGLAISVFFLLLLSLSEHIGFDMAYFSAAVATVGLITVYSASVLQIRRLAIQLALILSAIYGFIFVVLQLEDFALLVGSLGIFIALALVMYHSRKVDWYALNESKN